MAAMASYDADRVFVGGLPPSCATNDQLGAFFSQFGAVLEAKVFIDLHTGRTKGFGFIRFDNPHSVEAAISNDAQNVIDGKWVSVKRCESGQGGGSSGSNSGGKTKWEGGAASVEDAGLWVRGLPLGFADSQLKAFFEQHGQVVDCKVLPRRYPNNPDQAGLVRMGSPDQAQWCVDNLNNTTPDGFPVPMTVRFSSKSATGATDQKSFGGTTLVHGQQSQQSIGGVPVDLIAQAASLVANTPVGVDALLQAASAPGGALQRAQQQQQQNEPSNRLWVRGLPIGYNDEMLRELFSQFGVVSDCKVLPQKFPQNPDLAGVVRMATPEAAKWCIDNVCGSKLPPCEVPLTMRFAKDSDQPKQQPQQATQDIINAVLQSVQAGSRALEVPPLTQLGQKSIELDRIFVGGLPSTCTTEDLALFFSQFGSIADAAVHVDLATGKSKGFGFVRFDDPSAVELALQNDNGNYIDGKWVRVKRSEVTNHAAQAAAMAAHAHHAAPLQAPQQAQPGEATGVWIRGLPLDYTGHTLRAFFEQYAPVVDAKILPRKFPGNPDQAGLVRLETPDMTRWCMEQLNGAQPEGFPIPIVCKLSTSTAPVRPPVQGLAMDYDYNQQFVDPLAALSTGSPAEQLPANTLPPLQAPGGTHGFEAGGAHGVAGFVDAAAQQQQAEELQYLESGEPQYWEAGEPAGLKRPWDDAEGAAAKWHRSS